MCLENEHINKINFDSFSNLFMFSDDYYEEDFRSPPSNKASNSTASGRSSGLGDDYYDDEDKSESESEFGDDEDLLESWNDDDHWDIDVQVDPARRDEDSVECFNFMDSKFGQQLRASAPVCFFLGCSP
jgi:hypothetical protein